MAIMNPSLAIFLADPANHPKPSSSFPKLMLPDDDLCEGARTAKQHQRDCMRNKKGLFGDKYAAWWTLELEWEIVDVAMPSMREEQEEFREEVEFAEGDGAHTEIDDWETRQEVNRWAFEETTDYDGDDEMFGSVTEADDDEESIFERSVSPSSSLPSSSPVTPTLIPATIDTLLKKSCSSTSEENPAPKKKMMCRCSNRADQEMHMMLVARKLEEAQTRREMESLARTTLQVIDVL